MGGTGLEGGTHSPHRPVFGGTPPASHGPHSPPCLGIAGGRSPQSTRGGHSLCTSYIANPAWSFLGRIWVQQEQLGQGGYIQGQEAEGAGGALDRGRGRASSCQPGDRVPIPHTLAASTEAQVFSKRCGPGHLPTPRLPVGPPRVRGAVRTEALSSKSPTLAWVYSPPPTPTTPLLDTAGTYPQ